MTKFPLLQIGYSHNYAGHHCSWCFKPEGIREKLLAAQKSDTPRWGDYPEKLDLNYINSLIKEGKSVGDSIQIKIDST